MRAVLNVFICAAALAGGAALGALVARHPLEVAQAWNISSAYFGWAAAASTDVDASPGGWKPPTDLPAQPNWTWRTSDGRTYRDVVITGISPTEVTITHSLGIAHVALDSLPSDVQAALKYVPDMGTAAPSSLTPVAAMLNNKLINAAGEAIPTPGPAIKYYAIYYSAAWCPPCHAFTPTLVEWYQKFKPFHHDFELIFVSEDQSEMDMYTYMREMKMPWPAVRYAELPRNNGSFRGPDIERFANDGIPDLVLVDSSGDVLADSYNGANYAGPQAVIDYMNDKLGMN